MSRTRRAVIAFGCVLTLIAAAGAWIVYRHDFAFREERVTIPGAAHPLQATLALPEHGETPYGLVVFVHGDGPATADRDGFYRPIWESFARAGYASLSWNKPGVDGAPGNWLEQSMHDRAVETEAALTWARQRGDLDPLRTGLWGISQAGWVLPEVAVRHPELRFVIAVGVAIDWQRQGAYNLDAELRYRGASDDEIARAHRRRDEIRRLLRENASHERYVASGVDESPMSADRWRFVVENYRSDAAPTLPLIRVPVLLVLGAKDLNVDVAETERFYRASLPPRLLTVRKYPDASHSIAVAKLDHEQGIRAFLVAVFAPRALYAPGYLEDLRRYVSQAE
ncbi:alpha/beta hydrolase [Nocardia otitidiscaviarum]|uniref:alpha/beta hydrolase family protein n=1 Tax=Nocardia otitidiscaviarum TaxID=1823 RepID=UPI001FD2FD83|nr:CocE/NonD family hydrolase [Nocardia otitidiscaviarum]MCP9620271.1 alpha/beta hydrolase [Nocardia otitidiscaviarum]